MKRLLVLFAVLALVLSLGQAVTAQTKWTEGDGPVQNYGTGGATDSSTFTLLNAGADTTAWLDLNSFRFPPCGLTATPHVKVTFYSPTPASGDSIGYVVQYSIDKSTVFSKAKVYWTGASPYSAAVVTCDTHGNDPAYGFRYVRIIVSDDDSASGPYLSCKISYIFLNAP